LLHSQLLTAESGSIHHFDPSTGDLVTSPAPVFGLVLEAGGSSLTAYLRDYPHLAVSERVTILGAVASAVAFLHKIRIVHFDLKTDNVVAFSTAGHQTLWKLIDFDSSHDMSVSPVPTLSTPFHLTREYAAPEVIAAVSELSAPPSSPAVALAVPISEAMDIWSLGMIGVSLFFSDPRWPLLEGRLEFYSLSQRDIDTVLQKCFRPREAGFLSKCLKVRPSERHSVALSLAHSSLFSNEDSTVAAKTLGLILSAHEKLARVSQGLLELGDKIPEVMEEKLSELLLLLPTPNSSE
jgi:serine/threonine protein kinase